MKPNTHMKLIWILAFVTSSRFFTPIFGSVSSSSNRQNIFSNMFLKRATTGQSFPKEIESSSSTATKSISIDNIKKFLNMEFTSKSPPPSTEVVKAKLLQKHTTKPVQAITRDKATAPLNYIKKFLSWQFSPKITKDTKLNPSSFGEMKTGTSHQETLRSSTSNSVDQRSESRNNIENLSKVNLPQKVTREISSLNYSEPKIPGISSSASKGRATFTFNPFQQYSISSSVTDKLFSYLYQNKDSIIKCSGLKRLLDTLRQQYTELANQNAEIIRKENLLISQNNQIQSQLNTVNNNVLQLTQNVAYLQNDVIRLINLG